MSKNLVEERKNTKQIYFREINACVQQNIYIRTKNTMYFQEPSYLLYFISVLLILLCVLYSTLDINLFNYGKKTPWIYPCNICLNIIQEVYCIWGWKNKAKQLLYTSKGSHEKNSSNPALCQDFLSSISILRGSLS